ncbi:hypothetical protein [Streptomyces sp. AC558_RSS880]|uniref:hypothetical protein n=1 Tax=Streptomyces sp. AC558_RSS880 TaxID=2823687 RepID=UPI001C24A4BB|nr:hypothetical protein [Streptomyces sp. AC558_RSS880]
MGERQNDDGPAGRRRVHPEGAPSGHIGPDPVTGGRRVVDAADLEALLAAALIRRGVDAGAEQRAVAAFLAAREAGAHGARTRSRDDWRTRRSRFGRHSLKATLSVVVAGLTLSGVAVAGIGAAGSSTDGPAEDGRRTHAPSPGTTGPSTGGSAGPGPGPGPGAGTGRPDLPGAAGETEAPCRAYEEVQGRGKALDSAAWERLTEAAGGAANVDAYCAERLGGAAGAEERSAGTRAPEKKDEGSADRSGNGLSGVPGGDVPGDNATRDAGNGSGTAGNVPDAVGTGPDAAGNVPDGSTGKPGNPGGNRP